MRNWNIFAFLLLSWEVNCNQYDGYLLMKIFPYTEAQMEMVTNFHDPMGMVQVLRQSRGLQDSLDLLVPPDRRLFVEDFAKNMWLVIKTSDYGKAVDESAMRVSMRRSMMSVDDVFRYMSFNEMERYIDEVAKKTNLVSVETRGRSYEGRPLRLVKISAHPAANNPIIFIDAGIHAREWVAPAMALYIIDRLTKDPEAIMRELNGVDWYILPIVNPDGYEFSRSSANNRLWRKTRSNHMKIESCRGVDGNRNYAFRWAESGVSHNPCDPESYAGPKPFSEPETKIVRDIMLQYRNRIKLYVSLHAYGNYLVYPYGYTAAILPSTWKQLDLLAREVSVSIVKAGGKPLRVLSAGRWYAAAGGSDDFAFSVIGVPYSYTLEMTDGYEFTFPENRLKVVLPQFYQGFVTFGQKIKKIFGGQIKIEPTKSLIKKGPPDNQKWLKRYRNRKS